MKFFFEYTEAEIFTSAALTHIKLYINNLNIPIYILKVFTQGFVHVSFTWLYS